ncbi:uncharacterized protein LOC115727752 [Rhodamnia argentea]|uniref:Mitochondrial import inner membrane translocase subunit TIM50 n=1 Tax=Rhodamnia argentea TaxID=178133 RepID=A0ABM3HTB3_9MYRT|nr:uncharacterized protein LOC115727752 [Rhodamnia argentea]XP_048139846.1 uncharacterized protein LOC115727752 [Rhodamnia argentea]XP_048139847.1 uncharacterized protein LOC115727752 [Rhodamnia argentea]XP_048139848.1 uncharacterized protein LOC115727752 [Rhodamnia argentea]
MLKTMTESIKPAETDLVNSSNRKVLVQENLKLPSKAVTFSITKTEQQENPSRADLMTQRSRFRNLKLGERTRNKPLEVSILERSKTKPWSMCMKTPQAVSNSSTAYELLGNGFADLGEASLLPNIGVADENCALGNGNKFCECSVHEARLSAEAKPMLLEQFSGKGEAIMEYSLRSQHHGIFHFSPAWPLFFRRRKLLILDINGLLADIVSPPPKDYKADIKIARRAVFKRPFCVDFLKFCFERFDVGIWSSRNKKNVERVVDYLLGDMKHKLLFCWDLSHCTSTRFRTLENKHKALVFKEVRRLWEKHDSSLPWEKGDYDESNTLLLDDSPYKALLNPPHTAVFPNSYKFQHESDVSLGNGGDLRVYLEELAAAHDIRPYVAQHPFGQTAITEGSEYWGFYLRAVSTVMPRYHPYFSAQARP